MVKITGIIRTIQVDTKLPIARIIIWVHLYIGILIYFLILKT